MKNYSGIARGLLIGVIIGIAQDNIGLWISLGLAIGVAIDYERKAESSEKNIDKPENHDLIVSHGRATIGHLIG